MTTVLREFVLRQTLGDIGVEIEVEGERLPRTRNFWRMETDSSLKAEESMEYVLDQPRDLEGVRQALDYLDNSYTSRDTIVHDSVRAGVHVHINCQQLSLTKLMNLITTYLILENLLVHWCGEYREGNLFCLRSCDAEFGVHKIIAGIQSYRPGMLRAIFRDDAIRYSSMNLKALTDYGSVEFRSMRGTRNLNLVYDWAEALLNLRTFSEGMENPVEVIDLYRSVGPLGFAQTVLGEKWGQFLCDDAEGAQKLIHEGYKISLDVAYCIPDWSKFEPKLKKIGQLEFAESIPTETINEPEEDF